METNFKTVNIKRSVIIQKEGIEISCFIAGVNSGVYGEPFVVKVRAWAKEWFGRKFFVQELKLSRWDMIQLRDELNKVIEYLDEQKKHVHDESI